MSISWVAFGTRNSFATATTRTNGSMPVGFASGDLLISICCIHNTDDITPTGAGWQELAQWTGAGMTTIAMWKISDGTETTGPQYDWTNAAAGFTLMYCWRSTVGFATPVVKNTNTGSTSTHSVTGFNATSAGAWAVYMDQALANTALATPAGWTEDRDGGSATSVDRDTAGHKELAGGGDPSGNISVTGANAEWLMEMLELTESSLKVPVMVHHLKQQGIS